MYDLGLDRAADRFGQGVVMTIACAAHRGRDPGLRQALSVANGQVVRAPVAMGNQPHALDRATFMDSLLEGLEDDPGTSGRADPPADDLPGMGVDE